MITLVLLVAALAIFGGMFYNWYKKTKEGPATDLVKQNLIPKEDLCNARCISCKQSSDGCDSGEWQVYQADIETDNGKKNSCTMAEEGETAPLLPACA